MFRNWIWLLLALLMVLSGCSKKSADDRTDTTIEPLRKVIFLGVDGADWILLDRLIAEGRLPNFQKIVEEGATGVLRSMEPMLSPLLWTTMATGKMPEDHGILSFTVTDPASGDKLPITRKYRKVDAFWNFLSDYGQQVALVGWLATYPAEEANGIIVSDKVGFLAYASPDSSPVGEGKVYPASREQEIINLLTPGEDITYEEFEPFLHIDRDTFEKNKRLPFDPKNPINNMILLYATAKSTHEIAIHIYDTDHPDFLGVYWEFVDAVGHLFMPHAPPKQADISQKEYDMFKDGVDAAYIYQDRLIGEFIERMDENTVLMLASDHGFKSGDTRLRGGAEVWAGKAAMWHRIEGMVGFYGPGIEKGHKIQGASLIDITPTILALQGLPQAADMPGRVLKGAFTAELAGRMNETVIATLDKGRSASTEELSSRSPMSDEAMKKLEALGYVSSESPEIHNNLGQRYEKNGEFEKAIEEYKKAIELNPNFYSALNNLGVSCGRLKRYGEAEAAFKRALAIRPDDAYAMNNLAVMYLETGRAREACTYGEMAVNTEPNYANAHLTLGSAYATLGELEHARKEFERVLEIEPNNQSARNNLKKLRMMSGRK